MVQILHLKGKGPRVALSLEAHMYAGLSSLEYRMA
jgi:hypothetical protein